MLVNGVPEGYQPQCPVAGAVEEIGWNMRCPMSNQWNRHQLSDECSASGYDNFSGQCYRDPYSNYVPPNVVPQYFPQNVYIPPEAQFRQPPMIPNLPCHQNQAWDYSSMCYNVDGQACQYTNVVDLEDFMNNEKRKEKSRVAARCRRTKEMQIFADLTAALPAKKEEVEQLDKASVMRLAISYLRVRDVVSLLPETETEQPKIQEPKGMEEVYSEVSYMKALDGFVMVFSKQGDIVYCSENIADHLGVSQMEIMGQSVFEFSHPCDHDDIREALRTGKNGRRDMLLRLKCTLTSKGRNVHLKSASYKVIHISGHMLTTKDKEGDDKLKTGSMVAVGRPIPHPSNIEIPLDCHTFLSKHSLDMKFTYVDNALTNTLGFESDELVGRSLYDYHHAADSAAMVHQFKTLFSKGQCETGQYRFLARAGGYAWVQTQATVITDKQQKPISIVCVNYVISGIECKDEVFAAHQVQHVDLKPTVVPIAPPPVPSAPLPPVEHPGNGAIVAIIPPEEERPIPVTELIFAPLNQNMNKGFFMPLHDEGHTMLKDEPEILDHLAPSAGDACIPLENSPFDEMFNDFLSDNYCSLPSFLADDLANGSPVDSMSPESLLLSSPERRENDSSCEQSSLLTDLSLDAFDSTRSDNDIDDGNSPFIPTSDELPVLEPAVMWGALPDNVSMARPQPTEPVTVTSSPAPALQRLLTASTNGPPTQDLISNLYSDQGIISSRKLSSWDTGCKRVLNQDQEPCAKRVKRSPSPVQQKPSNQSSSVLMNLLDQQQVLLQNQPTNYRMVTPQLIQPNIKSAIPILNIIQSAPNKQAMPTNTLINQVILSNIGPMSPLSLNVDSPMYSLPSSPPLSPAQKDRVMTPYSPKYSLPASPNYSPAMSPALRERVRSPYTPQSLSPVGKYMYSPGSRLSPAGVMLANDPYLSKMQASPIALQPAELLMDTNVQVNSSDFWPDTEMLTGTNGLLTAFDDVKLG